MTAIGGFFSQAYKITYLHTLVNWYDAIMRAPGGNILFSGTLFVIVALIGFTNLQSGFSTSLIISVLPAMLIAVVIAALGLNFHYTPFTYKEEALGTKMLAGLGFVMIVVALAYIVVLYKKGIKVSFYPSICALILTSCSKDVCALLKVAAKTFKLNNNTLVTSILGYIPMGLFVITVGLAIIDIYRIYKTERQEFAAIEQERINRIRRSK